MSAFTWTPDFSATKNSKPTVSVIKFGDGYEARQSQGINTNPKSWSLRFMNRTTAEIDAIEAFLDGLGATQSFDWTPPRASTSSKFVCRTWSRSIDHATTDSITATFDQVFEA